MRECAAGADAHVLGVRAGTAEAEDLVADSELVDAVADCDDLARELHARRAVLRPEETREDPREERLGAPEPAVRPVDGRRVNSHEHLALFRLGPFHLLDPQDLGRPVAIEHDCSHLVPFRLSVGCGCLIGPPCFHMRPAR